MGYVEDAKPPDVRSLGGLDRNCSDCTDGTFSDTARTPRSALLGLLELFSGQDTSAGWIETARTRALHSSYFSELATNDLSPLKPIDYRKRYRDCQDRDRIKSRISTFGAEVSKGGGGSGHAGVEQCMG